MKKVSIITLSLVILINSSVVYSAPKNRRRNAAITANKSPVTTSETTTVNETAEQESAKELETDEIIERQTVIGEISNNLQEKINSVKNSCSGIKKDLDLLFGLNVASTVSSGLGTLASGGALVTGVMKSTIDKEIDKDKKYISKIEYFMAMNDEDFEKSLNNGEIAISLKDLEKEIEKLNNKIAEEEKKSKTLGNVRTGLMAGSIATSATSLGTSIASSVNAKKLAEKMKECNKSIDELKVAREQFVSDISDLDIEPSKNSVYNKSNEILTACKGYDNDNIKQLQTMSTVSAVTSGIGTAVSTAGTITSALANSQKVRNDDTVDGVKKEKNLNLASNIMAGVSTGTSGASTILSAVSISKAKKDSDMAKDCEDALK